MIDPEWRPIDGWGDFGLAVFNTLHDAHDNLLSSLPGYRERVVQVRLSSDEAGSTSPCPGHRPPVMAMGDEAGKKILRYFSMDQHRWVRFRVLMAELERNLATVEERLVSRQFNVDELFAAQVAARWERTRTTGFPILEAGNGATRRSSTSVSCGALAGCWQPELSARSLRLPSRCCGSHAPERETEGLMPDERRTLGGPTYICPMGDQRPDSMAGSGLVLVLLGVGTLLGQAPATFGEL